MKHHQWQAIFFGLPLLLLSLSTNAHRQHFSSTSLRHNPVTNSIELVHKFHEHDAALWLQQNLGHEIDITELIQQARFALYVDEAFSLTVDGDPVRLVTHGAELEDHYLFVYQELPDTDLDHDFAIQTSLLMDLHGDQRHLVNLHRGDDIDSQVFTRAVTERSFLIPDEIKMDSQRS